MTTCKYPGCDYDESGHHRHHGPRWWTKILITETCWLWTASLDRKGYGQINVDGRPQRAHRTGYELLVGPIPEGMQLDHLCRNRRCVNPSHLEPVTNRTNSLRGERASRRPCTHGFQARRDCPACRRETRREYYQALSPEQREQRRQRTRDWRARHPEAREKNIERLRERRRRLKEAS